MSKYKLKTNTINNFQVSISGSKYDILDPDVFHTLKFGIEISISKNKKYFYKFHCSDNDIQDFFTTEWVDGIKGFKQHFVSNNKYHMIFNEQKNILEIITWDNTLFVHGKLV